MFPKNQICLWFNGDALEAAAQDVNWRHAPVVRFMVHPVSTVSADQDLDEAIAWMDSLGIHRLPDVSRGVLVGLLTSESALRARAETGVYTSAWQEVAIRADGLEGALALADAIVAARRDG